MTPSEYLTADHRRLETLLDVALSGDAVDLESYDRFRIGLLRHIAIEETIVLPMVREHNGGFFADRQLHSEHGAIAALLVPPPTPELVRVLRALLEKHNLLEETHRTLYDVLDDCCNERHPELLDRMREHPEPPLSRNINNPAGLDPARRAVARAGYDYDKLAATG
jgi:hypothetical protein